MRRWRAEIGSAVVVVTLAGCASQAPSRDPSVQPCPAAKGARDDLRLQQADALLHELCCPCGGMRVFDFDWRVSLVFDASCMFESGGVGLRPEAAAQLRKMGAALGKVPDRSYLVISHSKAGSAPAPLPTNRVRSSVEAAAIVDGLEAGGLAAGRVVAGGYGEGGPWPADYDGPPSMAPQDNALIEIVLLPTQVELPRPAPMR